MKHTNQEHQGKKAPKKDWLRQLHEDFHKERKIATLAASLSALLAIPFIILAVTTVEENRPLAAI